MGWQYPAEVSQRPRPSGPLVSAGDTVSRLLVLAVVAAIAAAVTVAVVGVPLAVAGHYTPLLVVPVLVVGTVAGCLVARPVLGAFRLSPVALAVVAVGVGSSTAAGVIWPSQHAVVNRDPGAYTVTAQWLAAEGNVLVTGLEGPFAEAASEELTGESLAFRQEGRSDGRLYAQFPHMTAAVLAVASWVGGEAAMVRLNPLIGAAGLLALFLLLALHVRPLVAAVSTLVLAFSLPQVWFSRDTYSEPLAQVLLLGGLALLTVALRSRSVSVALFAGLALGAVFSARIDGVVYIASLAVVAGALVVRSGWERRTAAALVAGLATPVAVGFVDLLLRSPEYLDGHWSVLWPPLAAVGLALLVTPAVAAALARVTPLQRAWSSVRPRLVTVAPGAVIVVLMLLWQVRPLVQTVRVEPAHPWFSSLAAAEGIADGARVFSESSLEWFSWYLGPVAVMAAIVGLGIAARRVLATGSDLWLPLLVLVPATLLYWWRPSISPDHIWTMRRFLPAALPLVVLGVAVALDWLWDRGNIIGPYARPAAIGIGAIAVAVPALVTLPLADARELRISHHSMGTLCDALGPDAAALFLDSFGVGDQFPVAARVACGIPTAAGDPAGEYGELAQAWAREGRRLVVVASVAEAPHGRQLLSTLEYPLQHLETTVSRRPSELLQYRGALNLFAP